MDPQFGDVVARAVFAYVALQALLRLAGKRAIGEASPKDFVIAVVIGDLVDDLVWADVGFAQFSVAAVTLVATAILAELVTYLNRRAETVIDGVPESVLENGESEKRGMRWERVNEKELAELLRNRGFDRDRWGEIKHAFIETSGRIAVILQPWAQPATRADIHRLRRSKNNTRGAG